MPTTPASPLIAQTPVLLSQKALQPAIALHQLTFGYDKHLLFEDFSLEIQQGDFLCISGESGCGKSTLLRLINGLLLPQKGHVCIQGTPLHHHNLISLRRTMGFVLQESALFSHLTVYQNMCYCLDLEKKTAKAKLSRIKELLPLVNLSESLLLKFPHELSGGQRQRVGIIRGIAHAPRIVLMDEPFSALDPDTRIDLQDLVAHIHHQLKTTFVMVTHSLEEAEKLGTSLLKLKA